MTNNTVHLGDGVADHVKPVVNKELSERLTQLITVISSYLEGVIEKTPDFIDRLFKDSAAKQEIENLWSVELAKSNLVPESSIGLSNKHLIHNFRQEGYLDGLYVGYTLAMMGLAESRADENIVLSVRDFIRPNLLGHIYENRDEFIKLYKSEKYRWIETQKSKEASKQ